MPLKIKEGSLYKANRNIICFNSFSKFIEVIHKGEIFFLVKCNSNKKYEVDFTILHKEKLVDLKMNTESLFNSSVSLLN